MTPQEALAEAIAMYRAGYERPVTVHDLSDADFMLAALTDNGYEVRPILTRDRMAAALHDAENPDQPGRRRHECSALMVKHGHKAAAILAALEETR